jgi:hypothetical protein
MANPNTYGRVISDEERKALKRVALEADTSVAQLIKRKDFVR